MKRKIKKKPIAFLFIIVFSIAFIINFIFYSHKSSFESKLIRIGFSRKDAHLIVKNVPMDSYSSISKYDRSIINLINAKGYKSENFDKYVYYYDKNKNSNIEYIIIIVNSGYDVLNYPASSMLSSLVNEKYFIESKTARYLDYGNENDVPVSKIISIVNSNVDYGFYNKSFNSDLDDDTIILVNKFYRLPNDYEPSDLVTLTSDYNKGNNGMMRKKAAEAFMKMVDAARLDNIIIRNSSAYRSFGYQVSLYEGYVKSEGESMADIYSARAGYSEHQTGLCTDINTIDSSFDGTDESNWLIKNAYKYGFILRFPKDKEDITGYKYEPWHYRYVGEKAASIIYTEDLTLEEYYAFYIENK